MEQTHRVTSWAPVGAKNRLRAWTRQWCISDFSNLASVTGDGWWYSSVFCRGWQPGTVNHGESCWRQLWCFYPPESYLWYWLKIMIKYKSRQNTIRDNEVGNYFLHSAPQLSDAANAVYRRPKLWAPIWSLIHKCVKKTEIWNHLADIDQHFRYKF